MATINIRTAAIQYGTGKIDCHCVMNVMTPLGGTEFTQVCVLVEAEALGTPNWTDEDLCVAVATQLNVDPSEVAVVTPPTDLGPTTEPESPEP